MSSEPHSDDKQQRPHAVYERVSKKLSGFSPVFEFVVAISAALTLTLLLFQTCYMSRSNALTKESNENTVKANAAILREMQRTNALTGGTLEESKRQFDLSRSDAATESAEGERRFERSFAHSKAAAAAEQGLTRQSLAESRRALEVSQRARVGVFEFMPYPLEAGKVTPIQYKYRNSGNTTATEVRVFNEIVFGKIPLTDNWHIDTTTTPRSVSTLAAGEIQMASMGVEELPGGMTKELVAAVRSGERMLYMVGVIIYSDGFRVRRFGFCWKHERAGDGWSICPNNNWAD